MLPQYVPPWPGGHRNRPCGFRVLVLIEWLRYRQKLANDAVCVRHCSTALQKHVLPRLLRPGPILEPSFQYRFCRTHSLESKGAALPTNRFFHLESLYIGVCYIWSHGSPSIVFPISPGLVTRHTAAVHLAVRTLPGLTQHSA